MEDKQVNKKIIAAAFILAGTTIGAGILGLPYVFSQSGFYVGIFWTFALGMMVIFLNLYLGEVILRTKETHQLPGYAKKYLGKQAKKIMTFAVLVGVYSALLAYMVGEGQSFSKLVFGSLDYSVYFALAFWAGMTLLIREGLKGLKRVELWGVVAIIAIIFSMLFFFYGRIDQSNLVGYNVSKLFLPFGVVLFSLLGFTSIPEVRVEISGNENYLKRAIIIGTLIPIFVYAIFSFIFVGILGGSVEQISTLSFGKPVIVLGIFTMLTSYFVLSFVIRDIFIYDLRKGKWETFFFVSVVPLVLYFIITFFNLVDFVGILEIGGVVSGGLTGILILLMNLKSKDKGKRRPEFSVPINWKVIWIMSIIFILGSYLVLI